MSFDNIPLEIQKYNQWINWRYETVKDKDGNDKQTKVPIRSMDGRNASVNDPRDWTTFAAAVLAANQHNCGLGFVFTKSDPFTGIDLDAAEGNNTVFQNQHNWHTRLATYSEISPSGFGLHAIAIAALPGAGRRSNKIECYDSQRFFTFTGKIYNAAPIVNRQNEVLELYNSLGKDDIKITEFDGYAAEHYTDERIIELAASAANGEKFKRLWNGDWKTDYGHASQSEADFALVNIIAFYSRNTTQTMRLFRNSALGIRQKAQRGTYLMGMVRRAFDRMPAVASVAIGANATGENRAPWFDATNIEPWTVKLKAAQIEATGWVGGGSQPVAYGAPTPKPSLRVRHAADDPGRPLDFADPIPPMQIPGMVGELVAQCWRSSVHQIAEVSIASALSTMSLLCSRAYRHGSLGLPLYIMLLAQTSVGKSFAFGANDNWFNQLLRYYENLTGPYKRMGDERAKHLRGMVFSQIGSAEGLQQHISENPACLFHGDEYVNVLRQMAQPNVPPILAKTRDELLRLIEMSGPGRVYRGAVYSKRAAHAAEPVNVFSASLSILATGTPEGFYNNLGTELLTTGFLPRFTMMEYTGGLTRRNPDISEDIEPGLFGRLKSLFDMAYNKSIVITGEKTEFIDVQAGSQEAYDLLEWFDNVCYRKVNESNEAGNNMAGIWSRAKEHVRQIASLIAIGVNPHMPTIDISHVRIAIDIVRPALMKIEDKINGGETGIGDVRLESDLLGFVRRMINGGYDKFKGYTAIKPELIDAGFFQLSVIRNYCTHLSGFRNHRLGSTQAFEITLKALVTYGRLIPIECNGVKCVSVTADFLSQK